METVKKRSSLKKQMLFVFGVLTVLIATILTALSLIRSVEAVMDQVENQLIEKAKDEASYWNSYIKQWRVYLTGISMDSLFTDKDAAYLDKAKQLKKVTDVEGGGIIEFNIVDKNGMCYKADGSREDISDLTWFKNYNGRFSVSTTYFDKNKRFLQTVVYPMSDTTDILTATFPATLISAQLKKIIIGKTGDCLILDDKNVLIGSKDTELLERRINFEEEGKKDAENAEFSESIKKITSSDENKLSYYSFRGVKKVIASAKVPSTGWHIVVRAPINDYMSIIYLLMRDIVAVGVVLLIITIVITYFVSKRIAKPLSMTANILRDIAEGEGDLTVRLPAKSNDEIGSMALYFNQTIEKIAVLIRNVRSVSTHMGGIGTDLSSSMSETARAMSEISENIENVKNQTINQAASATEMSGTLEQIVHTIEALSSEINTQSTAVTQSSAAVTEMVENIHSVTNSIESSDKMIAELSNATMEGQKTLSESTEVTLNIAEESSALMEAASVIQNIAKQTNLLAMNAAIEAAHAGEAGKGFAVVADEIRKLAEESSSQGKSIGDTLKKLSEKITGLVTSSKVAEEKFRSIFTLSGNVKNKSAELTAAMNEQAKGSREVLTAIKNISQVTNKVQGGSAEMLLGWQSVQKEMKQLDKLTETVKSAMDEMARGVSEVNKAVRYVDSMSLKNSEAISSLEEELSKFKV